MDIQRRVDDTSATLELKGRFTFEDHQAFKSAVTTATDNPGIKAVTLDITRLIDMDYSALAHCPSPVNGASRPTSKFIIKDPRESVSAIPKIVNFNKVFEVREKPPASPAPDRAVMGRTRC